MTVKINADTSDGLKFVSDTSGTVDIQSNGTTVAQVTSSSIVGKQDIILDAGKEFCIGADDDVHIGRATTDRMTFNTGGIERARIDENGDFAIGTSSPRNELTVDGIISGITVNTSSGNSNTTIKSGMSGAYLAFVTWNNGSGYATLHVSTGLSSSGQIIASSNSSGGNNAFDVSNSFSSNSGNGIALFINGTNLNLQTKDNWSANAHPIRISLFGG
jgi:hypothetical protein